MRALIFLIALGFVTGKASAQSFETKGSFCKVDRPANVQPDDQRWNEQATYLRDNIERLLKRNLPVLRHCYERALLKGLSNQTVHATIQIPMDHLKVAELIGWKELPQDTVETSLRSCVGTKLETMSVPSAYVDDFARATSLSCTFRFEY